MRKQNSVRKDDFNNNTETKSNSLKFLSACSLKTDLDFTWIEMKFECWEMKNVIKVNLKRELNNIEMIVRERTFL